MKRVTLEIDDKFAALLSIAATGLDEVCPFKSNIYMSTSSFDLSKGTHIIIGEDGKMEQRSETE